MAEETKIQLSKPAKILAPGGPVERIPLASDGSVNVRHEMSKLATVNVADVDLVIPGWPTVGMWSFRMVRWKRWTQAASCSFHRRQIYTGGFVQTVSGIVSPARRVACGWSLIISMRRRQQQDDYCPAPARRRSL